MGILCQKLWECQGWYAYGWQNFVLGLKSQFKFVPNIEYKTLSNSWLRWLDLRFLHEFHLNVPCPEFSVKKNRGTFPPTKAGLNKNRKNGRLVIHSRANVIPKWCHDSYRMWCKSLEFLDFQQVILRILNCDTLSINLVAVWNFQ